MTYVDKIKEHLTVPEIETIKRVLDMILIIDISTSMKFNSRMAILNQTMRELMPAIKKQGKNKAHILHRIRCIGFSTHPKWIIGPDPVEVADATWTDLSANGMTATGEAINWVADSISPDKMPKRTYPMVIALVSDGDNTDGSAYEQAIARLDNDPWGKRSIRLAIGIGTDYDLQKLEKFTNTEIDVLEARNAAELVQYLKYATITVPAGVVKTKPKQQKALPAPPKKVDSDKNSKKPEVF